MVNFLNLQKFYARKDIINTFDANVLGHSIKEIKALFSQELISPEISKDEATVSDDNQPIGEETYFVPSIPWHSNEVILIFC